MAKRKAKSLRCPTCKAIVTKSGGEFPFCSERCRLIDLGRWASGAYKISSPILDPEVLENIERRPSSDDDDDQETVH